MSMSYDEAQQAIERQARAMIEHARATHRNPVDMVRDARQRGEALTRRCDHCGEHIDMDACEGAEIVRGGRVYFVHADSCMRDGDEIA